MKLLNSIKDNSVNHIVESGKDNSWSYTKYSNGTCELYGVFSFENIAITTGSGSFYYSNEVDTPKFPFSIVAGSADVLLSPSVSNVWFSTYYMSNKTDLVAFRANSTSSHVATIVVNILCIARWK